MPGPRPGPGPLTGGGVVFGPGLRAEQDVPPNPEPEPDPDPIHEPDRGLRLQMELGRLLDKAALKNGPEPDALSKKGWDPDPDPPPPDKQPPSSKQVK